MLLPFPSLLNRAIFACMILVVDKNLPGEDCGVANRRERTPGKIINLWTLHNKFQDPQPGPME